MAQITSIFPQRRRGRYNIAVDGDFAFALSEKALVDLRLMVGQEIDEETIKAAAVADDESKALAVALRLLEVRARSEDEICVRLKLRGYPVETASFVIGKLRGYGLVDDTQFAAAWIESRSRSQPAGAIKLRAELQLKGIAKETINEAIGQITNEDQLVLAKKALTKRPVPPSTTPEDRQAAYQRDASFLARRGFGWSVVRSVLKERYDVVSDDTEPD